MTIPVTTIIKESLQVPVPLEPQEFLARLDAHLKSASAFTIRSATELSQCVEQYGDQKAFLKAEPLRGHYLMHATHIAGGGEKTAHGGIAKGTISMVYNQVRESIEHPKPHRPNDYIARAGHFDRVREKYQTLFAQFPQFTMKDGELLDDCREVLAALTACIELTQQQSKLLGMDSRGIK